MDQFKFVMPASLVKADNGEWKIRGLASTESRDQQGEILMQKGIDLTPIEQKKGYLNFDHRTGVENLVGLIDGYKKRPEGLYIEGRLFKNHTTAKHIYDIMSSLSREDRGRAGLSVEGRILERDSNDPRIIRKCQIKNVAITFSPVNSDTYVDLAKSQMEACDLMKSMSGAEVEIDTSRSFTADEVVDILQKALGVGSGAAGAPVTLTGGDALTQEELDRKKKSVDKALEMPAAMTGTDKVVLPKDSTGDLQEKPASKKVDGKTVDNGITENGVQKSLKKMTFGLYKSHMFAILNDLQKLYPECSRSEIWEAVKTRLEQKFPELKAW